LVPDVIYGKSRDTGNIGYIRNRTKTNKAKQHKTIQKTKKMSNTDPTKAFE
jgi:hypothetical protein